MNQEKAAGVGNNGEALCTDRAELIERLKRGESPTWVPNQAVSGFCLSIHIFNEDVGPLEKRVTLHSLVLATA